jgi:hypothetical protein
MNTSFASIAAWIETSSGEAKPTLCSNLPFPDGTQRVLYCMESPELWFEDFGAAKLKAGGAVVKLDTDFAKVVKLNEYHVFVTPEGDCRSVFVSNKTATGFEVRELQGGTSNVAFSYRIVARRKDIKAHQRFAKIDTASKVARREGSPIARARAEKDGTACTRPPHRIAGRARRSPRSAGAQTEGGEDRQRTAVIRQA